MPFHRVLSAIIRAPSDSKQKELISSSSPFNSISALFLMIPSTLLPIFFVFLSISTLLTEDLQQLSPPPRVYGDEKRMIAIAVAMHEFNLFVKNHPNLETVVFPLRDGLTVIKYNAPKGEE